MRRYRNILLLSLGYLVILGLLWWYVTPQNTAARVVHSHAAFRVYKNNEPVDFSDNKYMHIEPCAALERRVRTKEEEQFQKAHLHTNIGDVVHVHRTTARWKDLFRNLPYEVNGTVKAYRDGALISNVLNRKIVPDERLLILIDANDDIEEKLESVPSVDRIREVERASESC